MIIIHRNYEKEAHKHETEEQNLMIINKKHKSSSGFAPEQKTEIEEASVNRELTSENLDDITGGLSFNEKDQKRLAYKILFSALPISAQEYDYFYNTGNCPICKTPLCVPKNPNSSILIQHYNGKHPS